MTSFLEFPDVNNNIPFAFHGKLILSQDYTPSHDVCIIGRGKKVFAHPGNQQFRALIDSKLPQYKMAKTKGLKSAILWQVLCEVRNNSADGLGFVKRDPTTGRWCAIDDACARINIAQAFRDRLSADYRSSKKHKQIKHKQMKCKVELGLPLYKANDDKSLTNQILWELEEQHPANRTSVAVNDTVCVDNSLGSMDKLRGILRDASRFSFTPKSFNKGAVSPAKKLEITRDQCITFDKLYKLCASSECELTEDPFEPRPIATQSMATHSMNMVCQANIDNCDFDFPTSFPMSEIVENTEKILGGPPMTNNLLESVPLKAGQDGGLKRNSLSLCSIDYLRESEPFVAQPMSSDDLMNAFKDSFDDPQTLVA